MANGRPIDSQGRAAAELSVPYDAVIFDMDGVVTDTASLHAAAWKLLFDGFLQDQPGATPFDADRDYRQWVDGRTREDGVRAFLASRGIRVPDKARDGDDAESVVGLATRKNQLFLDLLAKEGVRAFPSSADLVQRLRSSGVPVGLVTASRNSAEILAAAGVAGLFDVVVDGTDAARLPLAGKPDPAMFLEAARRLGAAPDRAVVIEDAVAGVEAGRRGGFGLVVGVDRGRQRDQLLAAGAHLVVGDLAQLDLGAMRGNPWLVVFEGFDPAHEAHREALTALGNGYLATRGAAPEASADGAHYPGTYLAGVYNRLVTDLDGGHIEHEHLVNAPNWLPMDLAIEDGVWWSDGGLTVRWERRVLDLRRGVLQRNCLLVDPAGRRLAVAQRRLVSMARPHVAALETTVVPENWSGELRVRSGVDVGVVNANVAHDRALANRHLRPLTATAGDSAGVVVVEAETIHSGLRIAVAARTEAAGAAPLPGVPASSGACALRLVAEEGSPLVIDKTVAIHTSRDPAIASPGLAAEAELARVPAGVAGLLPAHERAWQRLWDRFDIRAEAPTDTLAALHLHLFHLLQTLSAHTAELDAGVPARGLHGEGYRGHVFWDELFVFPLLTLRLPDLTRSLLLYRWRRLDAARDAARRAGLPGAMFPWQSGSDGREETPDRLFNPRSGQWMVDRSHRQRHVGLAVAYNVWRYFEATADTEFLAGHGAEVMVEVARLFAGMAEHDPGDDRYHIAGVMGPDEYHDAYPGVDEPGLRDNAYTNALAAWVLARTLDAVAVVDGCHCSGPSEDLGVDPDERARWDEISRRLHIPFHDGVVSQFAGYETLEELDWDAYRARYGDIGRLDLILAAEGDSTNRYKLAKQADVLMLPYLFSSAELTALFDRLGYRWDDDLLTRTIDYYRARTAHGSTLSRVVHSWVLARADRADSWAVLQEALAADLDDTQGGTTGEGVHLGAMAGTVDLLLRGFAGLATHDDVLWIDPRLPSELGRLGFEMLYRGQRVSVDMDHAGVRVEVQPCAAAAVRVGIGSEVRELAGGDRWDRPAT